MTLAQLAAAAGYVGWFGFGAASAPFSFETWVVMLVPPAVFAFLFVAGLFGLTSAHVVVWQRLLSAVGTLVAACGLVVSLLLLPILLLGSFMDLAIG